jgi:Flp pilus assembly protein TadB
MQMNMGSKDKKLRGVLAIVLLVLMFWVPSLWWLFLIVAAVMIVTVFTGYCMLYVPFGVDTRCEKPAQMPAVEKRPIRKAAKGKK